MGRRSGGFVIDWSLTVGIASGCITVGSAILALVQTRKLRTAKEAANAARRQLLRQVASQEFGEMARSALRLINDTSRRDWKGTGESAAALGASVAMASGTWRDLMEGHERDKLSVANEYIEALLKTVPSQDQELGPATVQSMLGQIHFVVCVAAEIAGRLKYEPSVEVL